MSVTRNGQLGQLAKVWKPIKNSPVAAPECNRLQQKLMKKSACRLLGRFTRKVEGEVEGYNLRLFGKQPVEGLFEKFGHADARCPGDDRSLIAGRQFDKTIQFRGPSYEIAGFVLGQSSTVLRLLHQ